MTINDGRQRQPAANAAVTLTGSVDGAVLDVYAVTALGNAYTLLAVVTGTDMSARADVRRLGTVADFPGKNGCVWQPLPGGGFDAYLYADQFGLHIRPFASAIPPSGGYDAPISGSVIIDPTPGSLNQATVWIANDLVQAKIWNHVPGITPPDAQQGLHLYSHYTMAVQSENDMAIYMGRNGKLNFAALTIQPWDGNHGGPAVTQATIWDSYGRMRLIQITPLNVPTPPTVVLGAGAGSSGASCTVSGTDQWGRISLHAGTAPAGSNAQVLRVNYVQPYAGTPYGVILTSGTPGATGSAVAQACYVDVTQLTASSFFIIGGQGALTAGVDYTWFYQVLAQ